MESWLGTVAHAYNPSTLGGQGRGSPEVRSSRPAWPTWWNPISTKNKISWAWWHVPIVPAIQQAEVEGSLEPGRWRLQWAEMSPLHSSLGKIKWELCWLSLFKRCGRGKKPSLWPYKTTMGKAKSNLLWPTMTRAPLSIGSGSDLWKHLLLQEHSSCQGEISGRVFCKLS